MATRSLLSSQLRAIPRHACRFRQPARLLTTAPPPKQVEPISSTNAPNQKSWLTQKIRSNPALYTVFVGLARVLGYGSPKQFANRRALHMYNTLCAMRADQEADFWRKECALPPTFQSWFTITNLHIWLLTVRLRALPSPHGLNHIQGLIDHFFLDVEERVRTVLQPGVFPPRTTPLKSPSVSDTQQNISLYPPSSFYTSPSPIPSPDTFPSPAAYAKAQKKARAPEKVVTRQMKILKEQWAGLGISMDLGLVRGDAELAAAVWRNLLGGRGARGISLPGQQGATGDSKPVFRRTVNLVGGLVEKVEKIDFDAEETKDDMSGVHDFAPDESDRYIAYPELMETLVAYIRREAQRLENLPDDVVLGPRVLGKEGESVSKMRWGKVRS